LRASKEGHIDIIDILLVKGADINFRMNGSATDPEDGFTPLMWAPWNDNAAFEHLLKKGADPNAMGSYHLIPTIMLPIYYVQNFRLTDERLNQLRLLIKYGADVNYKTPDYKKTALLMAVVNEDLKMVKLLLHNGALVNAEIDERIEKYYNYTNYEPMDTIKALIKKAKR